MKLNKKCIYCCSTKLSRVGDIVHDKFDCLGDNGTVHEDDEHKLTPPKLGPLILYGKRPMVHMFIFFSIFFTPILAVPLTALTLATMWLIGKGFTKHHFDMTFWWNQGYCHSCGRIHTNSLLH